MKEFDHDTITRYLEGEMNEGETRAFETQMQGDADLKNVVELYRDVNQTLKMKLHPGEKESALRNTLGDMRSDFFSTKTTAERSTAKLVKFSRSRWIAAAAAVCIGIVMLTVWAPWKKQDLYQQYASIEMPGTVDRGTPADTLTKLLKEATDDFNEKKFAEAVPIFTTIRKTDSANVFVQFYYAIALLQNGQTAASRQQLMELYNGSSLFKYDGAFYMALSYLKEKNNAACKEWLNKIPSDAGIYDKAQKLLKKL